MAMELNINLSKQREMAPLNAFIAFYFLVWTPCLILKQSRDHLYLKMSHEIDYWKSLCDFTNCKKSHVTFKNISYFWKSSRNHLHIIRSQVTLQIIFWHLKQSRHL